MTFAETPQLLINTETSVERFQLLEQSTWTIGRSKMNTLRLADRCASRHHAKLEIVQNRHCYFVDLNSRNGSLVNDQPVTEPVLLKHGDRIKIGNTELVFHHNLLTIPGVPVSDDSKEVVMIQANAIQGKIWQEVLFSQGVSVVWETATLDLQHYVDLNASAHVLPRVLLIDLQAYRDDPYEFCHWCRQRHPELKVILFNSGQRQIATSDRQQAIEQGCVNLLPAFREPNLLDNVASIIVQVNAVLQVVDRRLLRQDKLFLTLKSLEDLIHQRSSLVDPNQARIDSGEANRVQLSNPDQPDLELQDLTSLQARRKSSRF